MSAQLDHVVFAKACRMIIHNYNSDLNQIVLLRNDDGMSELPDAIRILNPSEVWISTNEVKLIFKQVFWEYGLHAIAVQGIKDKKDSLGMDVNYFKEWRGR